MFSFFRFVWHNSTIVLNVRRRKAEAIRSIIFSCDTSIVDIFMEVWSQALTFNGVRSPQTTLATNRWKWNIWTCYWMIIVQARALFALWRRCAARFFFTSFSRGRRGKEISHFLVFFFFFLIFIWDYHWKLNFLAFLCIEIIIGVLK